MRKPTNTVADRFAAAIVKTEAHEDEDSDGERDFLY
jgi:hypothetical protein